MTIVNAPAQEPIAEGEPLLLDATGVGQLLSISRRHLQHLDSSGRLGPRSVGLGRSRRWAVAEIRAWVTAGCPARPAWLAMTAGPMLRIVGGNR